MDLVSMIVSTMPLPPLHSLSHTQKKKGRKGEIYKPSRITGISYRGAFHLAPSDDISMFTGGIPSRVAFEFAFF